MNSHNLNIHHSQSGRPAEVTALDHHIALWENIISNIEKLSSQLQFNKNCSSSTQSQQIEELTWKNDYLHQKLSSENSLCNDHITCQNSVSIESSLRGFAEAISMSDRVRETSTEVLRNWSQWWGCEGDSYLEIVCLSKFLWYLHQYKLYKFLSSSSKLLKFLKMLVSLILSTRCTILSL